MKELEKQTITKSIVYVAYDGIEFDCKEECQKYEGTAKAVITKKFIKTMGLKFVNSVNLRMVYIPAEDTCYYMKIDSKEKLEAFNFWKEFNESEINYSDEISSEEGQNEYIIEVCTCSNSIYIYSLNKCKEELMNHLNKIGTDEFLKEEIKKNKVSNTQDFTCPDLIDFSYYEKIEEVVTSELKSNK